MKKLKVLLVAVCMLGMVSGVFAQPSDKNTQEIQRAVVKKLIQARGAKLINEIWQKGEVTPLSYTIYLASMASGAAEAGGQGANVYGHKKSYSKNGQIKGWRYRTGNFIYILFNRADWDDIDDECIPNTMSLLFGTSISKQEIKTDKYVYTYQEGNLKNYELNGKEYTLLTLSLEK